MKRYIALLTLALTLWTSAPAQALAQQADSAYNKADYYRAIELYTTSIAQQGVSSGIWYNLGNAYYRAGNLGQAVLCYERTLKLDPTNADARANLQFVNSRIQDKPEDDSSFLSNIYRDLRMWQHPDTWAWTAFALFALTLAAIALYVFAQNIAARKAGFFGGIFLLAATIFTLILASDAKREATTNRWAIVTAPSTNLSSTPGTARPKGDKVVPIHEGTKVEIIDSIATPDDPRSPRWYEVKINNSTNAWLRATDVERI